MPAVTHRHPRLFHASALALVMLPLLKASFLLAQPVHGSEIPIPHPLTSLVRAPSLYEELDLQAQQIADLGQAVDQADLPLWRLRDLPFDQRQDAASALINQLQTRLVEILTPLQMERLRQIVWQALGADAVLDPEMADRLKLSDKQRRHLLAFLDLDHQKRGHLQRSALLRAQSVEPARLKRLHDETQRNINAVLGPSQQEVYAMLLGRRFDLSQVRNIACRAPALAVDTWLNASPLTLAELRGKVVVLCFYAFGCGNCVRTLPYLNAWHERFSDDGLRIVGIHRPETEQERDIEKVRRKATEAGMTYPIAIDNQSLIWDAWANRVWPGIYLIDRDGYVRYWWYGELNFQGAESELLMRSKIRELLSESPPSGQDLTPPQ